MVFSSHMLNDLRRTAPHAARVGLPCLLAAVLVLACDIAPAAPPLRPRLRLRPLPKRRPRRSARACRFGGSPELRLVLAHDAEWRVVQPLPAMSRFAATYVCGALSASYVRRNAQPDDAIDRTEVLGVKLDVAPLDTDLVAEEPCRSVRPWVVGSDSLRGKPHRADAVGWTVG